MMSIFQIKIKKTKTNRARFDKTMGFCGVIRQENKKS